MPTEADTCRKFVVPKLQAAGWDNEPYSIAEQRTITDGRIVPVGKGFVRRPSKRVDYLLRYRRDFPLAVVEAKPEYKTAADGLQQAKQYAEMLGLKLAYASNGPDTLEFDYFTGLEKAINAYPSPEELWRRYRNGKDFKNDVEVDQLLTPINFALRQGERYYQEIAINRAVEAIVTGKRRILLTMATGTGKTPVAFQICWKLWNARWNKTGEHRRPKILYLSDRNILIDDPKDKIFAQFGDARAKIEYGNAIYQYSLRQGIEDGFLAPYRVHRVISEWDAAGWRPSKDVLDRYGREIPDDEYQTKDFERVVALRARTEAIARHLAEFMKKTDRFAKTIIFCVDQEHASEMRQALNNLNSDLVREYPDYVCRVTADEGDIGRGHLSKFQDVESHSPIILTTSQLLTTGVDAPTCKNIVIARVVGSMTEFKQIIGRGTRVRDDYGKLWFNIIDYTGSATQRFADPDFDGDPAFISQEEIDAAGETTKTKIIDDGLPPPEREDHGPIIIDEGPQVERRKYYFDEGHVEIASHLVYELDPDGKQLRVLKYSDYAAEKVRTLYPSAPELRQKWSNPSERSEIIEKLAQRGISFDELAETAKQPNADPFDLLCHLAFNAPLRTRRERAQRLREERKDFFDQYGPE